MAVTLNQGAFFAITAIATSTGTSPNGKALNFFNMLLLGVILSLPSEHGHAAQLILNTAMLHN